MRLQRVLLEIGYTVVAEIEDYSASFNVYKIEATNGSDVPLYQKPDTDNDDLTCVIDNAQVFLHGFVKWDGCSNWHFDEQDRVMLHGCTKEDLLEFGKIMAFCWELAEEHCPHFDRD